MRIFFLVVLILFHKYDLHSNDQVNDNQTIAIESFKRLPVQHEGRIKPMDTLARNSLLMLHGSQSLRHQGKSLSAIEWLLDVLMNSKSSKVLKLIRIENSDLLGMIGKDPKSRGYYSILDLEPYFKDIYNQFTQVLMIDENLRDTFQQAVVVLWKQIATYLSLSNTLWISGIENVSQELRVFEQEVIKQKLGHDKLVEDFSLNNNKDRFEWFGQRYQYLSETAYFSVLYPLNSDEDQTKWSSIGEGLLSRIHTDSFHPGIIKYASMISAYQGNDAASFNEYLNDYGSTLKSYFPGLDSSMNFEVLFNDLQPFFVSAVIYLLVFVLSVLSWIIWPKRLKSISVYLLIIGFAFHSFGLASRMIIEGRPPVTNLYSSAIFVGWGTVFFSLILERIFRNGIGCVVGAVVGSLTLIVAQHLTGNADTMEVMRAVLDSNFWLSTHVVTITLGYSSTFLAGCLGSIFIIRGLLTKSLNKETSKSITNMVYGVVCFSTLLSFTGTILGGIWADQSWGRFWGWDPKENGALLIILWNIMILHARIGGFVKRQGLMVMAVFGNVVTSLSWFGVNMLGVGLHSYGFMDGTFLLLAIFILIQLTIMCMGSLPGHYWRSRDCLKPN